MNRRRTGIFLTVLGLIWMIAAGFLLQVSTAAGQNSEPNVPFPTDYRFWYHVGSKSITTEGAKAIGLAEDLFGNTFDAVFANTIALNDLRNGTRPFRDGASFAAPFFQLIHPVEGLDAMGDLKFLAVMTKDSQHFADTGGWGFEAFAQDGGVIQGANQGCFGCHESQQANDFVFSALTEREFTAVPASDNGVFLPTNYPASYFVGAKVIRPDAASAIGLPPDIFGNTFSVVYANPDARKALAQEVRPFPQGSLFMADFHQAAFPVAGLAAYGNEAFTAVMLKGAPGTGDSPKTGDWRFEAFAPDGTPLKQLRSACIDCHAAQEKNDFVFTGGS
jgi:hypothetical protein